MFFHLSANLLHDTNKMCERKIPNFHLDAAADIYKKLMRKVSLKILRINFSSIHLHVSQMQTHLGAIKSFPSHLFTFTETIVSNLSRFGIPGQIMKALR